MSTPPPWPPAGDPNVPAGAVSWKAAIGRGSRLPGELALHWWEMAGRAYWCHAVPAGGWRRLHGRLRLRRRSALLPLPGTALLACAVLCALYAVPDSPADLLHAVPAALHPQLRCTLLRWASWGGTAARARWHRA